MSRSRLRRGDGSSSSLFAGGPPQPTVILRESGVSRTPRPLDSITDVSEYWIARFRGRRRLHTRPPSRDALRPSCARPFHAKIRGRGERRVPAAPAAPCAKVESTQVLTADTPGHPAFPHAMVLTAYSVISPVTGLVCHRHRRN